MRWQAWLIFFTAAAITGLVGFLGSAWLFHAISQNGVFPYGSSLTQTSPFEAGQTQIAEAVQATMETLYRQAQQTSRSPVDETIQLAKSTFTPTAPLPPSPTATYTVTPELTATATPVPTGTHTPYPTLTAAAAVLPERAVLSGVANQIETRNNCGPATLAMALSYWGWGGDQTIPQAVLRPNAQVDDKNVMPTEMAAYVQQYTHYKAVVRTGGDLVLLKRLVSGGFPVIVEKGHITTGWIGHYVLVTGYDDRQGVLLTQDSLIVSSNAPLPYSELVDRWWRHFNYLFMVVYPAEREAELHSLLGPLAEESAGFSTAAAIALNEIPLLEGRELFFSWFNLGASLAGLGNHVEAAAAFDQAYQVVYPGLAKEERPWRVLWYRTEPYLAYYSTGQFEQVISLADKTLLDTGSPILEESLYWRGLARLALDQRDPGIEDLKRAAHLNPNSTPALKVLGELGAGFP